MKQYCVYYIYNKNTNDEKIQSYFTTAETSDDALNEVSKIYPPDTDAKIVVDECKDSPYKLGGNL